MRRKLNRTAALALCFALLLAAPVLAFAGDRRDPLISRSYVEDTFPRDLRGTLDALTALTAQSLAGPQESGTVMLTLHAGDSVTLGDGHQLALVSGALRLEIAAGQLINCTLGRGSTGGDARIGHRYVAWGGARVSAACTGESAVVLCSASAQATVQPQPTDEPQPTTEPQPTAQPQPDGCPFEDVPAGAWYYADVVSAVNRGLVNGMTPTRYEPQGSLTLAQAVKLAACMRQLWYDGAVTLENGTPWYESYAAYALENGILETMPDEGWDAPATRETFVRLFYRALPEDAYAAVNDIPSGAIPDVADFDPGAREVYAFYAAGILTGYAEGNGRAAHEFGADTNISRAEVATIMNRMFDPAARVRFTI